jgi:hypothetical protein
MVCKVAEQAGLSPDAMTTAADPVAGAREVLSQLQPGDLALLLVLSERDAVVELINQYM